MLWREGYVPREEFGTAPLLVGQSLDGLAEVWNGPVVGFFDAAALGVLSLWLRLFAADELPVRVISLSPNPGALKEYFRPSLHATVILPDEPRAWDGFRAGAGRSTFAAAEGAVVYGPSTEDVWEEFSERIRRGRRGGPPAS